MFPANANYLNNAITVFTTLLSMSSQMVGLVLFPVFQKQTTEAALIKHRHALDIALMKGGLSLIHTVTILFHKPDSMASDKRALSQSAMACFHTHFSHHGFHGSTCVKEGKIGPVPLLKISDFVGYDQEVAKPGASARVEQSFGIDWLLVFFHFQFLIGSISEKFHIPELCVLGFERSIRKGLPCHEAIVDALLDGLEPGDDDRFILVDCLPNRRGLYEATK